MKITILIIAVLIIAGVFFRNDIGKLMAADNQPQKKEAGKKKDKKGSGEVSITQQWDLPADLKEISGLAWIDNNRFACVQDEDGKIFIYNTAASKVEKEIPFAGPGDYEGITVKQSTIYVVRSDGRLYEVDMNSTAAAKEYKTPLTAKDNIEGLCYDKANDRLLLAAKSEESNNQKHIFSFDLNKKELAKQPAYSIDLSNEILSSAGGKKKKSIMPSAIAINPRTNELFITDGPHSRLLVITNSGEIKKLYDLGKNFAQPEGITFNGAGELFISNEGTKEPGNILKVAIQ